MVVNLTNTVWPFHRRFFFTGGQRCIPFLIGHSLHIKGRGGGGLDGITLSMGKARHADPSDKLN
jgi:hypothetical protein